MAEPAGNGQDFDKDPHTIDVDGVRRHRLNSAGRLIHHTDQGIQNFWRWFGASQAVDAAGRPRPFYHGSAYPFDAFSDSAHRSVLNNQYQGDGFHFSEDPVVASRYAEASRNQLINRDVIIELVNATLPDYAAQVFCDVVLHGYAKAWDIPEEDIRHILDSSAADNVDLNDLLDIAEYVEGTNYHAGRPRQFDAGMIFGGNPVYLPEHIRANAVAFGLQDALPNAYVIEAYLKTESLLVTDDREQARLARENGYDGVYYSGAGTVGEQPELAVFSPHQIKSTIGNSGRFDPACARLCDDLAAPAIATAETIDVDGVLRPSHNSAGHRIHPTDEGVQNFWRWFDDSAMVDERGRPVVLWHGTAADFSEFSNEADIKGSMGDSLGFYFTDSLQAANEYAGNGHVLPVYLKASAPMVFDVSMVNRDEVSAKAGINLDEVYGAPTRAEVYWFFKNGGAYDGRDSARVGDAVLAAARAKGHDSAIFKERINRESVNVFMAFDAHQIKSALGNSGAFDPTSSCLCDASPVPTIVVDGRRRPACTASQQAIHPTEEGTRNFWRWFDGSQVVDPATGAPLVVFHGSKSAIDGRFNTAGSGEEVGAFFATHPEAANMYAGDASAEGGVVLPVFLSIKNPYRVTIEQWQAAHGLSPEEARAAGHDGYLITGMDRGSDQSDTWIAFRPEQIKSAIGNSGAFRVDSAHICDATPLALPANFAGRLHAMDCQLNEEPRRQPSPAPG